MERGTENMLKFHIDIPKQYTFSEWIKNQNQEMKQNSVRISGLQLSHLSTPTHMHAQNLNEPKI